MTPPRPSLNPELTAADPPRRPAHSCPPARTMPAALSAPCWQNRSPASPDRPCRSRAKRGHDQSVNLLVDTVAIRNHSARHGLVARDEEIRAFPERNLGRHGKYGGVSTADRCFSWPPERPLWLSRTDCTERRQRVNLSGGRELRTVPCTGARRIESTEHFEVPVSCRRTLAALLPLCAVAAGVALPAAAFEGGPVPVDAIAHVHNLEVDGADLSQQTAESTRQGERISASTGIAETVVELVEPQVVVKPEGQSDRDMDRVPVTIKVLNAEEGASLGSGMVSYANEDGQSSSVVQPLVDGVRLLAVLDGAEAPTEYAYAISSDAPLFPTFFEDGAFILHDRDMVQHGFVRAPWAFDAAGREVPSRFEWRDGVVIQVVDHTSGDYEYPIVADPQWTYSFDLVAIGSAGYPELGTTYTAAMTELKRFVRSQGRSGRSSCPALTEIR